MKQGLPQNMPAFNGAAQRPGVRGMLQQQVAQIRGNMPDMSAQRDAIRQQVAQIRGGGQYGGQMPQASPLYGKPALAGINGVVSLPPALLAQYQQRQNNPLAGPRAGIQSQANAARSMIQQQLNPQQAGLAAALAQYRGR